MYTDKERDWNECGMSDYVSEWSSQGRGRLANVHKFAVTGPSAEHNSLNIMSTHGRSYILKREREKRKLKRRKEKRENKSRKLRK